MKKDTWVVVANSSQARIFKANTNQHLEELDALVHPEGRLHTSEIIDNNQGETKESHGNGRHPMEPSTQPKKQEAINFAKEILVHLDSARTNGSIDKFYLLASPAFLGLLRQEMPHPLQNIKAGEVDKDVTHMKPDEIREYLPYVL